MAASLTPVDYDPFKPVGASQQPQLVPVDYDPFESDELGQEPTFTPVDYDPFDESDQQHVADEWRARTGNTGDDVPLPSSIAPATRETGVDHGIGHWLENASIGAGKSATAGLANTVADANMIAAGSGRIMDVAQGALTGEPTTRYSDPYFDRVQRFSEEGARLRSDAQDISPTGAVAGDLLGLAPMMVAGGSLLPERAAVAAEGLEAAWDAGKYALPVAALLGQQQSATQAVDVLNRGGDAETAGKVYGAGLGLNTAANLVPVSAPGRFLSRLATGGGLGAGAAAGTEAALHAIAPDYIAAPDANTAVTGGGVGALMGGIFGARAAPRSPHVESRAGASPASQMIESSQAPELSQADAGDNPAGVQSSVATQAKSAPSIDEALEARLADLQGREDLSLLEAEELDLLLNDEADLDAKARILGVHNEGMPPDSGARAHESTDVLDPDLRVQAEHAAAIDALAVEHGLEPAVVDVMKERLARPLDRDAVTGWHRAEQREPLVEAARQHVANTGERADYIEADLRNLGGLNRELGHTEANDVFRAFADILRDELAKSGAEFVPVRHGGDELSGVVRGAKDGAVEQALEAASRRIDDWAEDHGVAGIAHPKGGREGTGIYTAHAAIEPGEGNRDLFSRVDSIIEGKKKSDVAAANLTRTPVHELPVSDLTLSRDVPQFKAGANDAGVVDALGGTFDRRGTGPIQVWRRVDGRMEVISGRHRLDLARRSGEETIPAQVYDEAAGFDRKQAASLDAELNIRDGQGKVSDYVTYFQRPAFEGEAGRQAAESRGLLARATGRRAFTIARQGSPELVAAHRVGSLTDDAATRLAEVAPNDAPLQALGMKLVQSGRPVTVAANTVRAVKAMGSERVATGDMFGFDDSAIREAEAMARVASSRQRELSEQVSAVQGAAKRPEKAKALGVDVRDPQGVQRRVAELKAERAAWDDWASNPRLMAEVRAELGRSEPPAQRSTSAMPAAGEVKSPAAVGSQSDAMLDGGLSQARAQVEQALQSMTRDELVAHAKSMLPDSPYSGTKLVNIKRIMGAFDDDPSGVASRIGVKLLDEPAGHSHSTVESALASVSLSKSSTVGGDSHARGMPVDVVQRIADAFLADYNGNLPLKVRVEERQEHLYGPNATPDRVGTIKGAYHARAGILGLVGSNLRSPHDVRVTLRHEILGHYGLNTLAPNDKKAILESIVRSRRSAGMRKLWDKVDEHYSDQSELMRAEEVFARAAEAERGTLGAAWDSIMAKLAQALREVGLGKGGISEAELRSLARRISESIRTGEAKQQTFPHSDTEQFRREGGNADEGKHTDSPRFNRATEYWERAIGRPVYNALARATKKLVANDLLKRHGLNLAEDMPPEAVEAWRAYRRDIAATQRTVAGLGKDAAQLTPDERVMVSDYIERELKAGATPPAKVERVATLMTSILRKQSQELESLGMLSKQARERWDGRYLPRFYLRHVLANPFSRELRMHFLKGIKGGHLKGRGLFESVAVEDVPAYEKMGWEVRDPSGEQVSIDGLGRGERVQMWRDFTPAEREKMGEVRDAMFRFARGYTETQTDIARGRLFDRIAKTVAKNHDPGGAWVFVPDVSVPGTGLKKFGALAGKWVPGDVFAELKAKVGPESGLSRTYLKALSLWKEGKTALNPVTHVNNVVSNVVMADLAGINVLDPRSAKAYFQALVDYRNKGDFYTEAQQAGLFGGEWFGNEVGKWLPLPGQLLKASESANLAAAFANKALDALQKGRGAMGNLYQAEDQFFKLLLYRQARARGMDPADAVTWAERFVFDYSTAAPGVRKIKNTAVPFFNYTAKAIPALTFAATHYPWRVAKWVALLGGFNLYAYDAVYGDDADEMKQTEGEVLPDYLRGRSAFFGTPKVLRMPFNDPSTDHAVFVDISRFVPLGDLFDTTNQAGGMPLPAPLTPNNPLIGLAIGMLGNKDTFTGKDIVRVSDTTGEAAEKRLAWLYRQMAPNNPLLPGTYSFNRIGNAVAAAGGRPIGPYTGLDYTGSTISPGRAVAQTLGIKVRTVDLEREREWRLRDLETEERDIKMQMGTLRRNGSISEETRERKLDELREKLDRLRDERTEIYSLEMPRG